MTKLPPKQPQIIAPRTEPGRRIDATVPMRNPRPWGEIATLPPRPTAVPAPSTPKPKPVTPTKI